VFPGAGSDATSGQVFNFLEVEIECAFGEGPVHLQRQSDVFFTAVLVGEFHKIRSPYLRLIGDKKHCRRLQETRKELSFRLVVTHIQPCKKIPKIRNQAEEEQVARS
jgi:hypothetical protein